MRGDNVFIYQNIIIYYKYLHNNTRTFVEFLDQLIYAFFCPAPQIFVLAPPRLVRRPALLEKAPPRTSLMVTIVITVMTRNMMTMSMMMMI